MTTALTLLDLKLGVRMLIKYPGLALAGIAGIAVAVAIAAGGFSVVQANYRASSLPLDEGDRVVSLYLWDTAANRFEQRSAHHFQAWRDGLASIREVSACQTLTPMLMAPGAAPESIRVGAMSASGFGVARVRPLLGRTLTEADERPGAPLAVVLGESLWRGRFGADPAILGRNVQLGAVSYAVAGVMPRGFAFPVNHDAWVPLRRAVTWAEALSGPALSVFGRLAPGATLEQAQAEVAALGQRAAAAEAEGHATVRPHVAPYVLPILKVHGADDLAGILAMQGLVVSLLVLVCLNVAILVFTRTAMRETEIRLRTALGAGRGRIVAQLFAEALVLAAVAAGTGVGLAAFALGRVRAATEPLAADLPFWLSFRLTPEAALYAAGLGVLAAVIVGVIPGLQATGGRMQSHLRIAGAGESTLRLGKIWTVLIVAQVAFAVALLPPSVRQASRSLWAGVAGPGFAAEEFLTAQLGMDSGEPLAARQTELMRRLESDARVAAVTFAASQPGDEAGARIETQEHRGVIHAVRVNRIDPGFFRTFGVAVLAGRDFARPDTASESTAILVNQPLAQKLFRGQALGQRLRYAGSERWYEITGIVPDFPTGVSPGMEDSEFKIYHAAGPGQVRPAELALRLRPGTWPDRFGRTLREMAAAVDPGLHVREIRSMEEALRKEQWISRLEAGVLLGVTLSVLLLSAAGIYSLMAFTVTQRRREIGIRLALGASREGIVRAIFSRVSGQLAAGAAVGGMLSWAADRASEGNLMQGKALPVLAGVILMMATVGFLAALGPTRRSLRIQPTEALREP